MDAQMYYIRMELTEDMYLSRSVSMKDCLSLTKVDGDRESSSSRGQFVFLSSVLDFTVNSVAGR